MIVPIFEPYHDGHSLIRHDHKGVTIQFYAMMMTALWELDLKQQSLDRQESPDEGDPGSRDNPPQEPATADPPPPVPSSRLSGAEFVTWLNQKAKKYWKIGIHWLTALRDRLACPFDERAVGILSKL
jgi:hypothetical protein